MKNDNGQKPGAGVEARRNGIPVEGKPCQPGSEDEAMQQKSAGCDSLKALMLPIIEGILESEELQNRCAIAAFNGVPLLSKIKLLIEFAARRHSSDTHWPLPSLVFNELSSLDSVEGLDMEAIASAIIGAYRIRLNPSQRKRMLVHCFGNGLDVLERCSREWQLRILEQTIGKIEFSTETLGREIAQWLGASPMPPFSVVLDFGQLPDAGDDTEGVDVVIDPFGACCLDAMPQPCLVLFIRRIFRCAHEAGMHEQLKEFCTIALVHELVHLAHLGLADLDGLKNPRISEFWMETVADYVTRQWACKNKMEPVYAAMQKNTPQARQMDDFLGVCSVERLRVYLWFLRCGGSAAPGGESAAKSKTKKRFAAGLAA